MLSKTILGLTLAASGTLALPHAINARQTTEISCEADVRAANFLLLSQNAFIGTESFEALDLPTSEDECQPIQTFLNGVAAENALALTDPFPLDAPFPYNLKARQATSCEAIVRVANAFLLEQGAFIGTEAFEEVALPTSEEECPAIQSFLNGVAAENGLANEEPFPLDAPFPYKAKAKRQTTEISCEDDVRAANFFLNSIGAFIGTEPFELVDLPTSEEECPSLLTFLNGVAAENGVADQTPFPLDAPFPYKAKAKRQITEISCEADVRAANFFLNSIGAFIGTEPFELVDIPTSEEDCPATLSFLNGVAAENGVADQTPFPLDAPFPY